MHVDIGIASQARTGCIEEYGNAIAAQTGIQYAGIHRYAKATGTNGGIDTKWYGALRLGEICNA